MECVHAGGPVSAVIPLPGNGQKVHLGPDRPPGPPVKAVRPALSACAGPYQYLKRGLDFILALGLFLLTAPLVLAAMVLVRLTSHGPALYTQTRVGRGGRPFTLYKIRTMVYECESLTGARWSGPGDSRVTALGRLLRRTHLDELPQLWNVLRGEMSLVGPRPERPEFVPRLEQAVPNYRARLLVRPGLTGLAQLQLPPDTDLASVRRKLAYDLYYVQHGGLLCDLRLLAGTALKVLGVSFGALRGLLRLPPREAVERAYTALSAEAPRLAPARVHAT
jgi:lipopolysaccharide/colanic/teichoic acid biosynthesis glycosyltransferase